MLNVCLPIKTRILFSFMYWKEAMEYSINQPAVDDTKKNITFVILPYDIFILPVLFNKHKNKKDITKTLYLCLRILPEIPALLRTIPNKNARNDAKKECIPRGICNL